MPKPNFDTLETHFEAGDEVVYDGTDPSTKAQAGSYGTVQPETEDVADLWPDCVIVYFEDEGFDQIVRKSSLTAYSTTFDVGNEVFLRESHPSVLVGPGQVGRVVDNELCFGSLRCVEVGFDLADRSITQYVPTAVLSRNV